MMGFLLSLFQFTAIRVHRRESAVRGFPSQVCPFSCNFFSLPFGTLHQEIETKRGCMSDLVQLTKDNDIAIITINNPPVNALSPGVPEGISDAIDKIGKDPSVKAAVLIGGGKTFVAGADIKEFGKITSGTAKRGVEFVPMLKRMEDCPKPIVMAIHGTALGGGLELAMAGHDRVASPNAQVGQPEVKLGIIPGAAGTQRLPRLGGVPHARVGWAGGKHL